MINVVELCADPDEQRDAPCIYGNIVEYHACYCHRDDWKEGPRKCPVWRRYGTADATKWHKREWELIELPMHHPELDPPFKMEMQPCMPDDDVGGCPMFEPNPHFREPPK